MKTRLVERNVIVSIFVVMLLIYGVQGISYGQFDAPTITPGENNTSLIVAFEITLDEGVNENAYQVQLREKSPSGEWISKCVVIQRGSRHHIAGDPDVFGRTVYNTGHWLLGGDFSDDTFNIKAVFTDLEPGATYESRYRDTNMSECTENPPSPDSWSHVAEGTTHLVAPPRAEFVDTNLAIHVRYALRLDTEGGHIDLLKIPQAELTKLTELKLRMEEITDITGLEHATQLTELDLWNNQISDITPLAQLTQRIRRANLDGNHVEDVVTGLHYPTGLVLNTFNPKVSITPASVASPAIGEQITFNLNITGGEAVAGYRATVQFDDTALRYVSSANGDYLPDSASFDGAFFLMPIVEGNLVQLNAGSRAGESNGDGTLATLTFEVITAKATALTLSNVLLFNSVGEAFVPKVENAPTTEPIQLKWRSLTMRKVCVYLLKILLCVSPFIGCGSDIDEEPTVSAPAVLETVLPESGATIAANGSIALTFDKRPENFTIDSGNKFGFANEIKGSPYGVQVLRYADRSIMILGPFTMPVTQIRASWGATLPQQSVMLTYTVTGPDCCGARVTGGTVKDGDTDVDPEAINTYGKLVIEFSAEVTGNIALQTEAGDDVGWVGNVDGNMAVLELVKGRGLEHNTTYVIVGEVFDAAGDELWIRITFVTGSKD